MRESPEAQEGILTHRQDVQSDIMLNEVIICFPPKKMNSVVHFFLSNRTYSRENIQYKIDDTDNTNV